MSNRFQIIGAASGFLAVGFGAFGAHALKELLPPDLLAIFETAVRYQMYHSLALLAAGWGLDKIEHRIYLMAGWSFVCGIVLFSGSLYAMVFTGTRWLGAITPLGGVAFLAGWLLLLRGFWKRRQQMRE